MDSRIIRNLKDRKKLVEEMNNIEKKLEHLRKQKELNNLRIKQIDRENSKQLNLLD